MTLSAAEQYMLELINRARLDPSAEAARYGVGLNQGLAAGAITATAKEALAPNALLESAAIGHSDEMVQYQTFGHVGLGQSLPDDRISGSGYATNGFDYGELVGITDMAGLASTKAAIDRLHRLAMTNVIDSTAGSSDREAMMYENFREIGIDYRETAFSLTNPQSNINTGHIPSGTQFNAGLSTVNFGQHGTNVFLTGVAYDDADHDQFYSMGEGRGNITFAIGGNTTTTAAAGGYALSVAPAAGVSVTVTKGSITSNVLVDLSAGNVKLDLVGGTLFQTSGNLTLVSGVARAQLLGIGDLSLTGNAAANVLTGNRGNNVLNGALGADTLIGGAGNDLLSGGGFGDRLDGGVGNDTVTGGNGADYALLGLGADIYGDTVQNDALGRDTVFGSFGNDTIHGGGGDDLLRGEGDNDSLMGGIGNDSLFGGINDDRMIAGDGNDLVDGGTGRDYALLQNGDDRYVDTAQNDAGGADTVYGGLGNDTVNGGGGADVLFGEDGNDSLIGSEGADRLFGGSGHDTVLGGNGNDTVAGGFGRDIANLGGGDDVYTDTIQNDLNGADTVLGGAGNDYIHTGGGADALRGEAGNDTLAGGNGADRFIFSPNLGADLVTDFADNIDTLVFDDMIWGGAAMTASQVISSFAAVVGSDTVFTFSAGNVVTVAGITDLNAFLDDISII